MELNTTFTNASESLPCPVPNTSFFKTTCQLVAYIVLFILSILGNTTLIFAVRKHHVLQTAMNYYIVNMATADLLTTLFDMTAQMWFYAMAMLQRHLEWFDGFMGVFMCKFVVFIQGAAIACSIFTLAAIAVNRFVAVMFPLRLGRSKNTVAMVISVIWFASFTVSSPMLYAMRVEQYDGALFCLENWGPLLDDGASKAHYTLVLFSVLYVAPLLGITILYSFIAYKVWARSVPGNPTCHNQLREIETRKNVLKICITVVLVFALCWLPFYVYLMLMFIGDRFGACGPPEYVAFLGLLLGHANSSINPFIYFTFNSDYQRSLKKVLKRCVLPCKSDKIRMRTSRSTLNSYPSLRTFRELEFSTV